MLLAATAMPDVTPRAINAKSRINSTRSPPASDARISLRRDTCLRIGGFM
jgi:hypothetical protein